MKIFIGGSKTIGKLPDKSKQILAAICRNGIEILVGDCYGIDLAVQALLASFNYGKVTVYTACEAARHNAGGWKEKSMITDKTGFDAHREKDKAMIADCDLGIMLWDGVSKGTLANIGDLHACGKTVLIYDKQGNLL